MISEGSAQCAIEDLRQRLKSASDPSTKKWFENYLKHVIAYRGVKSPDVSRIVSQWRKDKEIERFSDEVQLSIAKTLIQGRFAEDKFAGTIYIQKFLLRKMDFSRILCTAEELFDAEEFFDWSTTDWFSMRVLGPLIQRHGEPAARRIAQWRSADDLWQRRSSIVPFRAAVSDEDYHPMIFETIAQLVCERDRFIQTGIGWVISDLSKVHPKAAAMQVERHFEKLSTEVIRRHTRYLPQHEKYKQRKRSLR